MGLRALLVRHELPVVPMSGCPKGVLYNKYAIYVDREDLSLRPTIRQAVGVDPQRGCTGCGSYGSQIAMPSSAMSYASYHGRVLAWTA
jgi:hypothetical protein